MNTPEVQTIKGYKVYEVPEIRTCAGCKFDVTPTECGIVSVGAKRSCHGNDTIFIEATPEAYATYITQRIQKELQP